MEFGKIEDLNRIDKMQWVLPPEDPLTRPFLNTQANPDTHKTKFYIGAPAWNHKEWIGRIYPPKNTTDRIPVSLFTKFQLHRTQHNSLPYSHTRKREGMGKQGSRLFFIPS